MKSAYELAMERLSKSTPTVKLTDAQKKKLGELDSKDAAKIAERELALKDEMTKAIQVAEMEKVEELQRQLVIDRKKLQAESEEKKDEIRKRK